VFARNVSSPAMKAHDTQVVIRCPYCVSGLDFRELIPCKAGQLACQTCAHSVRPGEISYLCLCRGCVEVSNGTAMSQSRWFRRQS
jgi:hypothetical protein